MPATPWSLVARRLRPALAILEVATPVRPGIPVGTWLHDVTFVELHLVDTMCCTLGSEDGWRPGSPFEDLRASRAAELGEMRRNRLAIQLGLRLQFGLDACTRRLWLRKSVPWTGVLQDDVPALLCRCWYDNALAWAANLTW